MKNSYIYCTLLYLIGCPGRVVLCEELLVDLVDLGEVRNVRQQDGRLHHVVEGAVGRLYTIGLKNTNKRRTIEAK